MRQIVLVFWRRIITLSVLRRSNALPVSQLVPVHPELATQVQVIALSATAHAPLFRHGLLSHDATVQIRENTVIV